MATNTPQMSLIAFWDNYSAFLPLCSNLVLCSCTSARSDCAKTWIFCSCMTIPPTHSHNRRFIFYTRKMHNRWLLHFNVYSSCNAKTWIALLISRIAYSYTTASIYPKESTGVNFPLSPNGWTGSQKLNSSHNRIPFELPQENLTVSNFPTGRTINYNSPYIYTRTSRLLRVFDPLRVWTRSVSWLLHCVWLADFPSNQHTISPSPCLSLSLFPKSLVNFPSLAA